MRNCSYFLIAVLALVSAAAGAAPEEWAVRRAKMHYVKGHGHPFAKEITLTLMMKEGDDGKPVASSLVVDPGRSYPILWTDVRDGDNVYYGNLQAIFSVHLVEKADHSRWDAEVQYDLASWLFTGVPEEVR